MKKKTIRTRVHPLSNLGYHMISRGIREIKQTYIPYPTGGHAVVIEERKS